MHLFIYSLNRLCWMSSMCQAKHVGRGRCLMYDSWFLLWPQLTGEVVQHNTPGVQRKALILLWTKKCVLSWAFKEYYWKQKRGHGFLDWIKCTQKSTEGGKIMMSLEKIGLFHWRSVMSVHVCRVTGRYRWGDET